MSNIYLLISENNLTITDSVSPLSVVIYDVPISGGAAETPLTIKTKYESNADTNALTDALLTKLTDDYTAAEIDTLLGEVVSNIDWKEAVATFGDLATTYPTPDEGWTASVDDEDAVYRYDGSAWILLANGVVPLATALLDGKLSKEDFTKIQGLSAADGAQYSIQYTDGTNLVGSSTVMTDVSGNLITDNLVSDSGTFYLHANNQYKKNQSGTSLEAWTQNTNYSRRTTFGDRAFEFKSDVADSSVASAGFIVNNQNVTTKDIQSWQSAGVEKAKIDKDGNVTVTNAAPFLTLSDTGGKSYEFGVGTFQNNNFLLREVSTNKRLLFINSSGNFGFNTATLGSQFSFSAEHDALPIFQIKQIASQTVDSFRILDSDDVEKFKVSSDGSITSDNYITSLSGNFLFDATDTYKFRKNGTYIRVYTNGLVTSAFSTTGYRLASDMHFNFSSTTSATGVADTGLSRDSAGVLKVTDGSTGSGDLKVGQLLAHHGTSLSVVVGEGAGNGLSPVTARGHVLIGVNGTTSLGAANRVVAIGYSVAPNMTTADDSVIIGAQTGGGLVSGHDNTIIGANINGLSGTMSANVIIGSGDGVISYHDDGTNTTITKPLISKNPTVTKTAGYTITNTDKTIIVNSASATTQTLPTAVGIAGQEFLIKNRGTGLVTVDTTLSQTMDDDLTWALLKNEALKVASDGTNWIIV